MLHTRITVRFHRLDVQNSFHISRDAESPASAHLRMPTHGQVHTCANVCRQMEDLYSTGEHVLTWQLSDRSGKWHECIRSENCRPCVGHQYHVCPPFTTVLPDDHLEHPAGLLKHMHEVSECRDGFLRLNQCDATGLLGLQRPDTHKDVQDHVVGNHSQRMLIDCSSSPKGDQEEVHQHPTAARASEHRQGAVSACPVSPSEPIVCKGMAMARGREHTG